MVKTQMSKYNLPKAKVSQKIVPKVSMQNGETKYVKL